MTLLFISPDCPNYHKTSSSSSEVDQAGRIAELERRLAEREEEARDLQTKLFESSLAGRGKLRLCFWVLTNFLFAGCGGFSDSPPLPARQQQQQQQSAARQLFEEEAPLPGRREDIASRHKGSSISFGWGGSPPDQRRKAAGGPAAKPSEQQTVASSARKPSAGLLVGLEIYNISGMFAKRFY